MNGRGRSPERNYDDGAGEDYRIGTLSKINNIIYCKNDCLQSLNLFSVNIHVYQKPSSAIFREGIRLGLVYRVRVTFR